MLGAVAIVTPAGARAGGPAIGYVKAEHYAKARRRPTLYFPGNLFDGRRQTVTCWEWQEGRPPRLEIGFKRRPKVTELRIVNGDQRSTAHFERARRVARLRIREPGYERTVDLPDARRAVAVKLDPPLRSERVVFEVVATSGSGPLVCLSDVQLRQRGRPLTAAGRLKYNPTKEPNVGAWAAGPEGAPERFLTLYHDGTFRWVYAPNDPDERGRTITGKWEARRRTLILTHGRKMHHLRLRRAVREDETGEPYRVLVLTGDSPFAAEYRDRWIGAL
ncbi:MAG: hypothetical protein D6729_07550 [Deltaproteobacteria bacterium]|nr:MAG: hypothetical protein D6729_07550 [Deltaproteobacteria bacterium]